MLPAIGRIVLYRFRDGGDAPAIVTAVMGDTVALTVFPVGHMAIPVSGVMHDEAPVPAADTWRWPPRDEGGPRQIGLAGT